MMMSFFHVQMHDGMSMRCTNVLACNHTQAISSAQRKVNTRAHDTSQAVRPVIVDTHLAGSAVMRISNSNRRTEHIIVRCRGAAERIEPFAVRRQLAGTVKGRQHFTRHAAAAGLVHIKMHGRPAASDGWNGKRGDK